MDTVQLIINGILLGAVYALLGIGMNIIFGIIGFTNLAHGDFVILGAYASNILVTRIGVNPILTLAVTVPCMFAAGYLLQRLLINRAMRRGAETALLVAFGISIILQDAMLLVFSADAQHTPSDFSLATVSVGPLEISLLNLLLFLISLLIVLILVLFLNKTYLGRAIRAVPDDSQAAAICGININRIYGIAMGISMAMVAVAGLCVGLKWTFYPSSGSHYLLISFIVVVIGGLGSIPGTLFAGMLFGLAQVIGGANYGMLISYIIMLVVLALNPKGLLLRNA